MVRLRHNAFVLAQKMARRRHAVERELGRAAVLIKVKLVAASKKILSARIYSVPVPVSGTGRALWKRAGGGGGILGLEKGYTRGATVVLQNQSAHSIPRYRLGTSQGRRIVSPGIQSVQWHEEAIAQERGFILETRRAAVVRALRN